MQGPKNCLFSYCFTTTLRLEREYLRNETCYRQTEKINYKTTCLQIWWTLSWPTKDWLFGCFSFTPYNFLMARGTAIATNQRCCMSSYYCVCVGDAGRHPVVTVDALFFHLSFFVCFFLSYFIYLFIYFIPLSTKFALASLLWKQTRSNWHLTHNVQNDLKLPSITF